MGLYWDTAGGDRERGRFGAPVSIVRRRPRFGAGVRLAGLFHGLVHVHKKEALSLGNSDSVTCEIHSRSD